MSVVAPMLPAPESEKTTVLPPLDRLLSTASRAWTVTTCVLVPFAVMEAVAGLMVEWLASTGPTVTLNALLSTTPALVLTVLPVAVSV